MQRRRKTVNGVRGSSDCDDGMAPDQRQAAEKRHIHSTDVGAVLHANGQAAEHQGGRTRSNGSIGAQRNRGTGCAPGLVQTGRTQRVLVRA